MRLLLSGTPLYNISNQSSRSVHSIFFFHSLNGINHSLFIISLYNYINLSLYIYIYILHLFIDSFSQFSFYLFFIILRRPCLPVGKSDLRNISCFVHCNFCVFRIRLLVLCSHCFPSLQFALGDSAS